MGDGCRETEGRRKQALSVISTQRLRAIARKFGEPAGGQRNDLLDRLLHTVVDMSHLVGLTTTDEKKDMALALGLSEQESSGEDIVEALASGRSYPKARVEANTSPWVLSVEAFGKIRRADVRPRSLTLLVGENNSGKSYLASLLWGLSSEVDKLFNVAQTVASFRTCVQRFQGLISRMDEEGSYILCQEDYRCFELLMNDALVVQGESWLRRILNAPSLTVGSLRIALLHHWGGQVELSTTRSISDDLSLDMAFHRDLLTLSAGSKDVMLGYVPFLVLNILQWLLSRTVSWLQSKERETREPVPFLPSSRTGFILTYRAVVQRSLRSLAGSAAQETRSIDLSLPMTTFLERLAVGTTGEPGPFKAEAEFLERSVLEGKLEVRTGPVNEFVFHPDTGRGAADISLNMHLSSSLVTELAPLIYILRYAQELRYLVLEEPEAHLHPYLQRKLAQVVVRLVRRGVRVCVTTHSENFCQQINNFINLGTHPLRDRMHRDLGYSAEDYLFPDEVVAYQFTNVNGMSEVLELETSELGVAMPSFNEELYSLAKESQYLSETREEE